MTETHLTLCETIQRLGYAHNSQIKLYGESFQLLSDPIVEGEKAVFVDGREMKSHQVKRLRIPLPIVMMAQKSVRSPA